MMKRLRTQMRWIMLVIAVAFLLSTFFMYEGRGRHQKPRQTADGTMENYEVTEGGLDFILSAATALVIFYIYFEGKVSFWRYKSS